MVLPHGNVIGLFFLQRFKEQVKRRLIIVILLSGPSILDHGQQHLHGLFLLRGLMEQVEHKGGKERGLGLLPKWIRLLRVLWRGVFDKVVNEAEHISVLADITEGVVAVGAGRVHQINDADGVASF